MDSGGIMSLTGQDIMLKLQTNLLTGGKEPVQNLMVCGEKKTTLQIGVEDEAKRAAENEAVKQDIITKNQESKSKFLNGVVSLETVVGLTTLTIATGGATAPLLIAAGVKATFAVADIAEKLDGYSRMNAMDASQPANFLRDIVFGGNQFLYNMTSMVTDVVFDVVSGKALMKAAKGGKLISKFQQVKGKAGKFWDGNCKL